MKEKTDEMVDIIIEKRDYYRRLINSSVIAIQQYKTKNILSTHDINIYYNTIQEINNILDSINETKVNDSFEKLQTINDSFSNIFKFYGTQNIDDVLIVALGNSYLNNIKDTSKYKLIQKYFHPCSYKNLKWKTNEKDDNNDKKIILQKNKIVEDFMIVDNSNTLDCFDLARTSSNFYFKTMGVKLCFQCKQKKTTMIISGLVDNVYIPSIQNEYLNDLMSEMSNIKNTLIEERKNDFSRFLTATTLKEIFVYDAEGLFHRFNGFNSFIELLKKKDISQIVKEFISLDMYEQRRQLIYMLIKTNDKETQYLSYLLYDLLSNETNNSIDTLEQTILYDSLPWNVKTYFKDAMKYTLNYTNILSSEKNIPLEQQICLMKASEQIKEKAMAKLKEIKSKSEDSGFKARQYLEGLLKIPFGSYKNEPILSYISDAQTLVNSIINDYNINIETSDKQLCIKDIDNILLIIFFKFN